jgi:hypothetical protein
MAMGGNQHAVRFASGRCSELLLFEAGGDGASAASEAADV